MNQPTDFDKEPDKELIDDQKDAFKHIKSS